MIEARASRNRSARVADLARRSLAVLVGLLTLIGVSNIFAGQTAGNPLVHPLSNRIGYAGAAPPSTASCQARQHIACYDVAQIRAAYNLAPLAAAGYDGAGRTIALVDVYGSPTISQDLASFDAAEHLPAPPSFKVIQPAGPVPPYRPSGARPGWALETSLDVEWAHAMAPGASILLVETPTPAGSDGNPQLVAAERYVVDHHLADVISQSFGAAEVSVPRSDVLQLRSAYVDAEDNHVSVLAATGDSGATESNGAGSYYTSPQVNWPAIDPLVTAVGGTELHLNSAGQRTSPDTVWNDTFATRPPAPAATGGGLSKYFTRPYFQDGVAGVVGKMRGVPDIAMNAANSSSVIVYVSFPGLAPGWYPVGGTSEATPLLAGVVAIADGYADADLGFINPALYTMYAQHAPGLIDVTQGNNTVAFGHTTVVGYSARVGYDLVSGVGSIDAASFVPELAASAPYVRTISYSYTGPCSVDSQPPVALRPGLADCPAIDTIQVSASDRYLSVIVHDATGSAVPFYWAPAGAATTSAQLICGYAHDLQVSHGSFTLAPTVPVGDTSCALPPTTGSVTVQLSNHP